MQKWDLEEKLSFPDSKTQNINRKIYLDEYKGQPVSNLWCDIKVINPMSKERSDFDGGQKPEAFIERILTLVTNENDLVLDSFLGSGTTAAVAHKMNRRYIGIEMGEHAKTHCAVRLQKVIDSEQGGISKEVQWQGGGGFRFYKLGEAIFDEDGRVNKNIRFEHLAADIWFSETKTPLNQKDKSPLLGVHNDIAYYLLYNGILGDKSVFGGNILTTKVLASLPSFNGTKIIYGEASRLSFSLLEGNQIIFKQAPYDIKASSVSSFNNIIVLLKSYELRNEDHKTQAQFISEINRIHLQVNPEVDANLNYVWILSGRYTYKQTNSGSAAQNANGVDVNDGYNRIRLGIKIARKATAKKLGKPEKSLTLEDIRNHGPMILFNGGPEDNEVLEKALAEGEITDYPKEKFNIFSLPKEQVHTGGQFKTLQQQYEQSKVNC